jgi:hypothetical protein
VDLDRGRYSVRRGEKELVMVSVFVRAAAAGDIGDRVVESEGVLKRIINDKLLESLLRVCLSFVNIMNCIGSLDSDSISEGTILTQGLIYSTFIIQEETAVVH